jgi:hypothetical protein
MSKKSAIDLDATFANSIEKEMKSYGLKNHVVASIIGLTASGFGDLLSGKNGWKLSNAANLAMYFGKTLDELVFGDKDFIEKNNAAYRKQAAKKIKDYLVREKKYRAYGELQLKGFFDELDNEPDILTDEPRKK